MRQRRRAYVSCNVGWRPRYRKKKKKKSSSSSSASGISPSSFPHPHFPLPVTRAPSLFFLPSPPLPSPLPCPHFKNKNFQQPLQLLRIQEKIFSPPPPLRCMKVPLVIPPCPLDIPPQNPFLLLLLLRFTSEGDIFGRKYAKWRDDGGKEGRGKGRVVKVMPPPPYSSKSFLRIDET